MAVEIVVPVLGESVMEAVVGKWLKSIGDTVVPGEAIVELETEKVNLEVPAERGGVLEQIVKSPGDTVGVGMVLGTIQAAPAAETVVGTTESAKGATVEQPGEQVAAPPDEQSSAPTVILPGSDCGPTPLARRIAEEGKIDISAVQGTGIAGRVMRSDVAAALNGGRFGAAATEPAARPALPSPASPAPLPLATAPAPPGPAAQPSLADRSVREKRVRMSRRRQTIARRLLEAQHSAAMLTTLQRSRHVGDHGGAEPSARRRSRRRMASDSAL